ncbi:metallophosphoesterase [Paenibacillus sp. NPDC056722]|uniref:metallophosphoesterase n=1 Tax=Paenibacillus sp. NPDC056722 TaxID=3345924 RepID=UPI0036776D4B
MVRNAFKNRIIAEEIFLETLPASFDGYRILFITDIHRRRLPSDMLKALKGKVDAVFAGGDLTEKNSPLDRLAENMELLVSIAPTYAVHGNHDYKADIELVDEIIRNSGVRLLLDENVLIERKGGAFWLTGVDFPKRGGKTAYAPLPALSGSDPDVCRIFLVHDPMWLSQRRTVPGELVLSGHTHGGQVILPLIGSKRVESFYDHYKAGMYPWPRNDGSGATAQVLISRGFGTAHLPIRWGSPAEMHVLTLRCKEPV